MAHVTWLARRAVIGAALLNLVFCLCGCGDGRRSTAVAPAAPVEQAALRRVVCGSPAVTEIVFALGCAERVVGVSDYSVYPPEATAKAGTGGWANPNLERLLVLKPDSIVTQGRNETLAAFALKYGIRFQAVKLDTLEDLDAAITSIAELLRVADRGAALKSRIDGELGAVRRKVAGERPPRVLLLLGRTPGSLAGLSSVGPGSFLDELIGLAGGSNVFGDAQGAYPQVSKESLLVRRPDVILELYPGGLPEETRQLLRADWQEFNNIPAVQSGSIHYLTNDFLLIPGPRVGQAVLRLAAAIHPGLFHE